MSGTSFRLTSGATRRPACLALGLALLAVPLMGSAQRAYVSNEDDDSITVIDTDGAKVVATVDVGKRPRGLKLSPDDKHLYVAVSGLPKCGPTVPEKECAQRKHDLAADGIGVIDTATLKLQKVLQSGSDPEQFDISPDGRRLFISNEDSAGVSVVDIAAGKVITKIPVGNEPEGARVTPDGHFILITSEASNAVSIIDASSLKVVRTIAVGKRPRDAAFSTDSSTAYITGELDSSLWQVSITTDARAKRLLQLRPEAKPMGVVIDAARGRLYVSTGRGGTVAVISVPDGKLVQEIPVGPRPWGIALSKDGRRLYTANGSSNDVTIVDTTDLKVVGKVATGRSPWGVVLDH